jgi:hypothetical protein
MMPCLTVVDGQSFMVLNLSAEANRSGETWGKTFQRLAAQGVVFEDVVSDNASGIRAGLKETGLDTIWRLDVFHSVYEGHKMGWFTIWLTLFETSKTESETHRRMREFKNQILRRAS